MKSVLGLSLDMNDSRSETIVKKIYFLKSRIVKALRGAYYVMSDVYLLLQEGMLVSELQQILPSPSSSQKKFWSHLRSNFLLSSFVHLFELHYSRYLFLVGGVPLIHQKNIFFVINMTRIVLPNLLEIPGEVQMTLCKFLRGLLFSTFHLLFFILRFCIVVNYTSISSVP